jgi:hypothetical protein
MRFHETYVGVHVYVMIFGAILATNLIRKSF